MKNILILSTAALLLHLNCLAQCIVNAGKPVRLCEGDTSSHVFDAQIIEGVPPFKITWSYYYEPYPGVIRAYTASDYLNDTTILNPSIRSFSPKNQERNIKIEVIDSTGAECSGFVAVSLSAFVRNTDSTPKFVKEGDSIQLCFPSHTGGGIEPYQSYKWSLSDNIWGSDTGDCIYTKPIYRKDCSPIFAEYIGKTFTVIAKDVYGCTVRDGDDVAILTTGLVDNGAVNNSCCTFNNQNNTLQFLPTLSFQEGLVSIYDISGKKLIEQHIEAGAEILLNNILSVNGVYIVNIETKGGMRESKKIFFARY